MISRYSRKQMEDVWSDKAKYSNWLEIEIAVCEAWAELGVVPEKSIKIIKEKAEFDVKRINELETVLKHDVLAFLTCVAENVGDESRFIHLGLTSSDILDTSLALQFKQAGKIIIRDIKRVLKILKSMAFEYKDVPMIGRSHGIHAEPKTVGLVFALWYDEMKRNLGRMQDANKEIAVGMMSGAVGTYANISPKVEIIACKKLGLKPANISTQVISRDIHAQYIFALSLIAASIEKIATEIRHFQRTEVLEMEEPFTQGQKGSSAMPHKRNPILSENLSGLSRVVRSYLTPALENITLWHERDISHSSVERIMGPDSTILIDFMLNRLKILLEGLQIYPEKMKENIWLTKGLVFSQKVLLKLISKGLSREKSYDIVQRNAMKCWEKGEDFKKLLLEDKEVVKLIKKSELDECFDIIQDLGNINYIFKRVFK